MANDLSTEIASIAGVTVEQLGLTVPAPDVLSFVEELLYGERQLVDCLRLEIVTSREVADALADRLSTWLQLRTRSAEEDIEAWNKFIASATKVLSEIDLHKD